MWHLPHGEEARIAVTPIHHNALPELRSAGHDDHACGVLLLDLIPGAGQRRGEGKREIVIDGGDGRQASIRFNSKGKIKEILIPAALKHRLAGIIECAGGKSARKVISTTLLGYRPLDKYYRVDDWVQLRPVETVVLDHTMLPALPVSVIPNGRPHAFVLEVAYTSTPELPMFEAHRGMVALNEAKLLVSAFLEFSIHQNVLPYAWVSTPESKTALARCTTPHLENPPDKEFSDVDGLRSLSVTDEATYFKRLGVGVSTFEVPDMAVLRAKYDALSADDRACFLRACANLWDSGDNGSLDASRDGKRLVSSISAIEALLPEGDKCSACGAHIGITKRFKAFVHRFVPTNHEGVLKIYDALYPSRSRIAHGSWHDIVDQPMFGLMMRDGFTERLAAWNAAKIGAIGWLNAGGNSTAWWSDRDHSNDH